ncbi:MAG: hypothetical protein ACOC1L_04505 [Bacillota bacterium]
MKKLLALLVSLAFVFALTACGEEVEEGDFTPGVHTGYSIGTDNGTGKSVATTATLFVNENGVIDYAFIDVVYPSGDETDGYTYTTKHALEDDYGMKGASPIGLEWYEQSLALGEAIVEEQGWPGDIEDGYFAEDEDVYASVTIRVTSYKAAFDDAMEQATE